MVLLGLLGACAARPQPVPARDVADANDTGRTLSARNGNEQQLLGRIGALPSGTPQRVAGLVVQADAPYAAASGRTCRTLTIEPAGSTPTRNRVACTDGKRWFFVPNVFGLESTED